MQDNLFEASMQNLCPVCSRSGIPSILREIFCTSRAPPWSKRLDLSVAKYVVRKNWLENIMERLQLHSGKVFNTKIHETRDHLSIRRIIKLRILTC